MLNVFITVDTELWPESWDRLSGKDLREMLDRYIYGKTAKGDFGLPFQVRLLKDHGVKATFFVESLFSEGFGRAPLAEIVDIITAADQEVQLHIHTEWVDKFATPILPGAERHNIGDCNEADQHFLIGKALENLRDCGVENLCAFRAGNYGANHTTLRVLKDYGFRFDTSYNYNYLDSDCQLQTEQPLLQATMLNGICELPITCFEERRGYIRHAQLASCSYTEFAHLLAQAEQLDWGSFVIVSHSFELLNQAKNRPNPVVIKRFEKLCQLLADNKDKYQTPGFSGLDADSLITNKALKNGKAMTQLQSNFARTAWRYGEQAMGRLLA